MRPPGQRAIALAAMGSTCTGGPLAPIIFGVRFNPSQCTQTYIQVRLCTYYVPCVFCFFNMYWWICDVKGSKTYSCPRMEMWKKHIRTSDQCCTSIYFEAGLRLCSSLSQVDIEILAKIIGHPSAFQLIGFHDRLTSNLWFLSATSPRWSCRVCYLWWNVTDSSWCSWVHQQQLSILPRSHWAWPECEGSKRFRLGYFECPDRRYFSADFRFLRLTHHEKYWFGSCWTKCVDRVDNRGSVKYQLVGQPIGTGICSIEIDIKGFLTPDLHNMKPGSSEYLRS